jgi:hypothetical protein
MKDTRSAAVRKHMEGEENTVKQEAKVVRVVKRKKTGGAVTKKNNSLMENLYECTLNSVLMLVLVTD